MASNPFKPFTFSNNDPKPPPPPPKDPVYLQLRAASSRVSLQPTIDSPLSPSIQYAIRRANSPAMNSSADFLSPGPSHLPPPPSLAQQDSQFYNNATGSSSKASLATSTTPAAGFSSGSGSNQSNSGRHMSTATKKEKALAFLKFPKRSPRSPPAMNDKMPIGSNDDEPPPPQEDDGISLPWNFQHNIHVDEGYVGLPPSWSTSLASAGFSPEEIAAIHARRLAGMRSPPSMSYLYNERPASPAGTAFGHDLPQPQAQASTSQQVAPTPSHIQPAPRTTSLPRLLVPGSESSSSAPSSSQKPVLHTLFTNSNASTSSGLNLKPNPNFNGTPVTTTPVQRVPPPKRKPPTPYDEGGGASADGMDTIRGRSPLGHRQNELSTSTSRSGSSSNHEDAADPNQTADSFAGLNNSVAYRYNPPSPPPPMPANTTYRHPYANPANINTSYSSQNLSNAVNSNGHSRNQSRAQSRAQSRTGVSRSDNEGGGSSLGHEMTEEWDDDEELPDALKTLRLGSESTVTSSSSPGGAMSLAGGTSKFRVVNGNSGGAKGPSRRRKEDEESMLEIEDERKPKQSLWNKGNKSKAQANASLSSSGHGHSNSLSHSTPNLALSSSDHAPSVVPPHTEGSTSSHPESSAPHAASSSGHNTSGASAAFTAAAASASSSIAHASSVVARQSSNLVGAMREGVGRMRSGKGAGGDKEGREKEKEAKEPGKWGISIGSISIGKKGKGKDQGSKGKKSKKPGKKEAGAGTDGGAAGKTDGEDSDASSTFSSDEEFASLPVEGEDLETAKGGNAPIWPIYSRPRAGTDASQNNPYNASQYSLGAGMGVLSPNEGRGKHMPSASQSSSNLMHGECSNGQDQSLRGTASQSSLRSKLGKGKSSTSIGNTSSNGGAYGQMNRSAGSLHSLGAPGRGHHRTGSSTSLESIPEGDQASPERERPPMPDDAVGIVARNSMKKKDKRRTMGAPPRLSLLPDSTDLSSWSESLLSGISLSGDGGLGLSFGLDSDAEKEKEKEKEREKIESPGTAVVGTARPWERNPAPVSGPSKPPVVAPVAKTPPISTPLVPPPTVVPVRATNTPPPPAVTAPIPPPPTTTTPPPTRIRKPGQPLPTSKPPPSRPIPPIIIANPNGISAIAANNLRIERSKILATSAGMSTNSSNSGTSSGRNSPALAGGHEESATATRSVPRTPLSPNANKPLPSLAAVSQSSVSSQAQIQDQPQSQVVISKSTAAAGRAAGPTTTADGMLSPRATDALSPAGSSAGPDSAQLWNEIEQMMDPGMISAIPGLHLSVALPPGAKDVLKSAGLPTSTTRPHHQQTPPPLPLPLGTQTVGDMVGSSPPPAEYSAALTETFSATLPFSPEEERVDAMRKLRAGEGVLGTKGDSTKSESMYPPEDDDDDASDYEDEGEMVDARDAKVKVLPPIHGTNTTDLAVPSKRNSKYLSVASFGTEEGDSRGHDPNRDSSRSSSSTLTVTAFAATTIVRNVSVARRAGAYVIDHNRRREIGNDGQTKPPSSPLSSHFGDSEESGGSGSGRTRSSGGSTTSSSQELYLENPTPTTDDGGVSSPLLYYLDGTQTPSPNPEKYSFSGNGLHVGPAGQMQKAGLPQHHPEYEYEYDPDPDFEGYPDEETMEAEAAAVAAAALGAPSTVTTTTRPTILISEDQLAIPDSHPTGSLTSVTSASPLSPLHPQYRGWLSFAVQPLSSFIDSSIADPRLHYLDLREIAEGESGSVYAARVNMEPESYNLIRGRLLPSVQERDEKDLRDSPEGEVWVAIKSVAIVPLPSASAGLSAVAPSQAATISATKLRDLKHELTLLRDLSTHDNILGMDAVYVDLLEDSLWVRMELMERSLADIIVLAGDGLQLQERVLARFTSDILSALDYLQKHNIAHRDVRSDNLLLNKHGVLKLAEFSNAVQVSRESPMRDDVVGVVYWQAPEVRRPPYNALKVDVWSLGATVWEMAQQDPPFSDTMGPKTVGPNGLTGERWPPLRQPELYSPAFHDFLRRCSEPAAVRPDPAELLKSSFIINKACGRHVIVLLLTQCMTIEKLLQEGSTDP